MKGREETETYLASFSTVSRTYTIRFASKEDNICLSVYRKEQGYKHFPIPFKNLSTIADLVMILEDAGFFFINRKGQPVGLKNVLQPILGKQSVENELGTFLHMHAPSLLMFYINISAGNDRGLQFAIHRILWSDCR